MKKEIFLIQDACDEQYIDITDRWVKSLFKAKWFSTYTEALEYIDEIYKIHGHSLRVPVKISKVFVPVE